MGVFLFIGEDLSGMKSFENGFTVGFYPMDPFQFIGEDLI